MTACAVPEVAEVWLHTTVGLVLETWPVEHRPQPTKQTNGCISARLWDNGECEKGI